MPAERPPDNVDCTPNEEILPTGTVLWRIHHKNWGPPDFTPTQAGRKAGRGRFDGTADDPYPYLYAAPEQSTAVAEQLLRSRRFNGKPRTITRAMVRGKRLSAIETTRRLRLIKLVSAVDLATVFQDEWLVHADGTEFTLTRQWAHWLRRVDDTADGIVWQSRRDRPKLTMVLFGDRCGGDTLIPSEWPPIDLDTLGGLDWLKMMLKPYRATIDPGAVTEVRLAGLGLADY